MRTHSLRSSVSVAFVRVAVGLLVGGLGGVAGCSSGSSTGDPAADSGAPSVDTGVDTGGDDGRPATDGPPADASPLDDVTDVAPETDVAPSCVSGLSQPTPACQACQDAHCCVTASDCARTKSKWSCTAAGICRASNCQAECALPAPTCGDIVPDPASCLAATRASCCTQLSACAQSDECLAMIYLCIDEQACDPSKPCFAKCRADWPTGSKVFDVVDKCYSTVSCP